MLYTNIVWSLTSSKNIIFFATKHVLNTIAKEMKAWQLLPWSCGCLYVQDTSIDYCCLINHIWCQAFYVQWTIALIPAITRRVGIGIIHRQHFFVCWFTLSICNNLFLSYLWIISTMYWLSRTALPLTFCLIFGFHHLSFFC